MMWMRRCVVAMLLWGASPVMAAGWEGTLQWPQPITLGTTLSGTVERGAVKAGERVQKGQELMRLEQPVPRARVEQQKARLAHTELLLSEAQKELERSEELYERTLLSDHDLNAARVVHAEAKSRQREAKAALAEAEQQLRDSVVRAPFAALVLARHVAAGESVNGQWQVQPLYTIANTDRLAVRFSVPLADSVRLHPGMALNVTAGGKRYAASVDSVSADPSSAAVQVEVLLAADEALAVGMPAEVTLP